MRNKKGQSILEYVIVLIAIVGAVLAGALIFAPKDTTKGLGKVMNTTGEVIKNATGKMRNITD